jgi:hypothetical protein
MQLSSIELRTLVAAQIASGLVGHVALDSPQATIDGVAQLAVRIAKDGGEVKSVLDIGHFVLERRTASIAVKIREFAK